MDDLDIGVKLCIVVRGILVISASALALHTRLALWQWIDRSHGDRMCIKASPVAWIIGIAGGGYLWPALGVTQEGTLLHELGWGTAVWLCTTTSLLLADGVALWKKHRNEQKST